jgi:tetratricopeptide (TPR) repeat protein
LESNKDELKDLEMAKKRNHKIMITDDAIKKVRRIKYEYIDESEYDIIHELVKRVLQIAKNENDSNEVAITYCMNGLEHIQNGEEYVGVALGTEHDVNPISNTTSYHLVMSTKECIVIILHNHPSLSDFSLSDVKFLLEYVSVKMIVAVTNLGSISYLVKGSSYSYVEAVNLLNEAIDLNNKSKKLKDLQKAADYFLKNSYKVGIKYDDH